jgi:hypothetical protein
MIDPRDTVAHFVIWHVQLLGEHVRGVLHAVAEADGRDTEALQIPAIHRHRVGIVDHLGARADFLDIGRDGRVDRRIPHEADHAARAERIAHRLIDPIVVGDRLVDPRRLGIADVEGHDHEIGIHERGAAIGGRLHARREIVMPDQFTGGSGGPLRTVQIDVHQRERAVAQFGEAEDVADQA